MTNEPHPDIVFGLHLVNEITTATQLLAVGLNQIIEPNWYASEPATSFTCMASGVERILKLTFGLSASHQGQPFPSAKQLQKLGHDLIALEGFVHPPLTAKARALGKGYVADLLADVGTDPYWPGLLATLDSWASASGRYRDLTILTGEKTHQDPPTALWDATERACLQDLGLWAAIVGPDNRAALVQARTRLALSILKWWHAIFRVWTHGLLGPARLARDCALTCRKPLPRAVPRCASQAPVDERIPLRPLLLPALRDQGGASRR
ncbi:hypothetical protein [Intrasporangium sp. DVR]|uniref:hypothetical protein n=1 Tax=Intrasporangium sp. DVR TaxID=3127867 RepID=UPI00313A696A